MMMKLNTNANIEGATCFNACTKSAVLSIFSVEGILISMMSSVIAMANTPSQKASSLEVEVVSDIGSFY